MSGHLAHRGSSSPFVSAVATVVGETALIGVLRRFEPLDAQFAEELTGAEALAIYIYTTPMEWYLRINAELRSLSPSPEVLILADVLDSALRKLRPFRGSVYRGITVRDVEPFLEGHPVGQRISMSAFTSAARHQKDAYVGNVLFTIRSRSAAIVWMWSADLMLDEVVFPRGTIFEVISVTRQGDKIFVVLEEV